MGRPRKDKNAAVPTPGAGLDLDSHASFPTAALSAFTMDADAVNSVCNDLKANKEINESAFKRSVLGMLAHICGEMSNLKTELNEVKAEVAKNSDRIKALEDKVGTERDCAVPLSITMQKLARKPGFDDLALAKSVINEINAEGVNSEEDVIKVTRKGMKPATATQREWPGTLLVELKSTDVKARVMKAKKSLANHAELKEVKISNMKTQQQMNQDFINRQMLKMLPEGHKYYITGTGAMRPVAQVQVQGSRGPPPHVPPPPANFTSPPPSHLPGLQA